MAQLHSGPRFSTLMVGSLVLGLSGGAGAFAQEAKVAATWGLYAGAIENGRLVCLYREGRLGLGKWRALIDPTDTKPCQEYLRADIGHRRLHLAFDAQPGAYQGGKADAHCDPLGRGYTACTSSFTVQSFPETPSYRSLDPQAIEAAVQQSDLRGQLDQLVEQQRLAKRQAALETYRAAYNNAATVEAIFSFRTTYSGHDPENLIPQLDQKLAALESSAFEQATDRSALKAFIAIFGAADPAGLAPQARARLATLDASERSARAAAEYERETRSIETEIKYCKALITASERTIAREREVQALTGVANLSALHKAGETIVTCRDNIPKLYATYKQRGGRKALSAI